jgi:hypothetical protein
VKDVTGAYVAYQVHPDHAGLVDEVIDWYDGIAADIERTAHPARDGTRNLARPVVIRKGGST